MSINNPDHHILFLRKRNFLDSIFKALGWPRPFQVGYEEFDREFFVKSYPKRYAAKVLHSADIRDRLLDLHRTLPFTFVRVDLEAIKGRRREFRPSVAVLDVLCDFAELVEEVNSLWVDLSNKS